MRSLHQAMGCATLMLPMFTVVFSMCWNVVRLGSALVLLTGRSFIHKNLTPVTPKTDQSPHWRRDKQIRIQERQRYKYLKLFQFIWSLVEGVKQLLRKKMTGMLICRQGSLQLCPKAVLKVFWKLIWCIPICRNYCRKVLVLLCTWWRNCSCL